MKAAVLHEFKTPLALEDVPRPVPGPEEVLFVPMRSGFARFALR